jgi:hypothetical protein
MTLSVGAIVIDLNTYATIGDLAAYINQQSGYSAVVTAGQENASSLEIDAVTALTCVGGAQLESSMYAIVNTINNGSNYVEATAVNATIDITVPTNFTTIYMTGGTDGSYTGTEWTAALLALEAEEVQFISTPESDASIHSSIKTHCETMSSVDGRKERQFLVGGAWGAAVATATAAAIVINSKWGLYVANGFTQRDVDGVVQNYAPGYAACMLAGMCGAQAINAPLTFKKLNVISLENKYTNSELETFIENGVCPLNYNSAGSPIVVRQVNTYQTDDLKWNEFSMVKEMAFVSRDIRAYLEGLFVGGAGNTLTGGVLRGAVESKLAQYTDLGIFSKDADGLAWWNIQITVSGDTVYVDYDAYLTAPVNFIFITNHFHELASVA